MDEIPVRKEFLRIGGITTCWEGGGGVTPINRVYGDDPLDRVWFFDFFVIDGVSILRLVSSRFEFRLIARVLG